MATNPLQQYFRRPALYFRLPSGGAGYPPGTIDLPENGELPVFPMTAIDDITIRTPDALFNGNAVVELIKSCVPNIKDPWSIPAVDLDPILVAIRIATEGNLMDISTECPSCKEESKYDVQLAGILAGFKPGDYNTPLTIGDMQIKFRPLPYKYVNEVNMAQFDVQKIIAEMEKLETAEQRSTRGSELMRNINSITVRLLTHTIEFIKTPTATVFESNFIQEFLENCDSKTFEMIKDKNVELRSTTENKPLEVKCMHCGFEYKQPFVLNVTDFFE